VDFDLSDMISRERLELIHKFLHFESDTGYFMVLLVYGNCKMKLKLPMLTSDSHNQCVLYVVGLLLYKPEHHGWVINHLLLNKWMNLLGYSLDGKLLKIRK